MKEKSLPNEDDLQELDMENFCLPELGKGQTNAVFNSLRILCKLYVRLL